MSQKTYLSEKPSLSVTLTVEGKADTIFFVGGRITTADENEQKAIEDSSLFASGHITLAAPPDPRQGLADAAAAAAAAADIANKVAAEAERAYADFVARPKTLRAAADAAATRAKAAADELAAFDKSKAPVAEAE